jgi:hypothetical protein
LLFQKVFYTSSIKVGKVLRGFFYGFNLQRFIRSSPHSRRTARPTFFFTESGNLAALKTLLKSNPDLNARLNKKGDTALIIATRNDHSFIVAELIAAGANVHVKNQKKQTALNLACQLNHKNIAVQLLNTPKYKKQVNALRTNIFTVLLNIQKSRTKQKHNSQLALLPTNSSYLILSNPVLYPDWYRPFIKSDIKIMLKRINELLIKKTTITHASRQGLINYPAPIVFSSGLKAITDPMQALSLKTSASTMLIQDSKDPKQESTKKIHSNFP